MNDTRKKKKAQITTRKLLSEIYCIAQCSHFTFVTMTFFFSLFNIRQYQGN